MEGKRILIIDDDKNVLEILTLYLKRDNFKVATAMDGEGGLSKAREFGPDLIILDIMMPKVDGLEVVKELRRDNGVPIILLSAKSEELDRVLGLELGADDYVTKPFSPREILARVKAILKRVNRLEGQRRDGIINYPNLTINPRDRIVEVRGEEVDLSPKEYELLLLLARHHKQVFKRERLCDSVWGMDYYGDTRTVDVHIKWLRDKIKLDYIKTVWGVGYKFEVSGND